MYGILDGYELLREKLKLRRWKGNNSRGVFSIICEVIRGSFTSKVTFKNEGDEGKNQATIWGNSVSGEGTESAKVLCSHGLHCKEAKVSEVE